MLTSFGRFNLIFNKMALIFLGVFIVFTVSSFEFHKSDCLDFIANNEWSQFTQPQSTGLSGLMGNAGVLTKAATETKTSFRVSKMHFS